MKASMIRAVFGALALLVAMPIPLFGQAPPPPAPPAQDAPLFSQPQLDQLLAPVALYPDELVAQILMAATYPLEVVEAARWVQDPNNARLRGDQLAAALQDKDWDPSVKSLVPFPQILQMMSDRLDWMEKLGDAFLAQQSEVMDSVQRLRLEARNAGSLGSSPQQVVSTQDQVIVIEPASPDVIYVPVYDPTVVYGVWPYPAYPPYYFPPPPGFVFGVPFFPGFWWGPVVEVGFFAPFWGWSRWDWGHHAIHVDRQRYDRIPGYRPPVVGGAWQHDPHHRRGVAYRDPGTAARYGRPIGSPDARRAYRGHESAPPGTPAAVQPGTALPRPGAQPPPAARQPAAQRPPPPPPTVQRPATIQPGTALPRSGARPPPVARHPAVQPPPAPAPTVQRPATIERPPAPAFGGYQRGADTRAESARGRASLQSIPQRGPAPSVGAPRSAGGGGGGGRPSGGGHSSGGGTQHR